jgi:hypothetical protein
MKYAMIFLLAGAMLLPLDEYAQTAVQQSIPVQSGQTIQLHFDYPELIKITTWDKNEISIQGTVSINQGEHDDAFVLKHTVSGNVVTVRNEIRDMETLPQRYTIMRNGQKITFPTKEAMKKYQQENGGGYDMISSGLDMKIILEIKVPRQTATRVTSVYGMVEVRAFQGPITVDATYGGVDAAVTEKSTGEITAETNFGEIFSNLDVRFAGNKDDPEAFHLFVAAIPGTGPKYALESKYGNVYIRKAN